MSHVVYHHQVSQSIESRLIHFFMGLFGMKRAMEKKIVNNHYRKKPASIPKSFFRKFNIEVVKYSNRRVWTISPGYSAGNTVILFLHGGAYYANINRLHWTLIKKLINSTNTTFIVPDYPLAPECTYEDTYHFLDTVYANLISDYSSKQIVFMGDSAGGGLALGFAQKIRNEDIKQPSEIFLCSPWLDVSMENPEIARFDKRDKILNVNGLKIAGKNYAGDLDLTDYRVSPLYGDFTKLGKISIFIGTNEIFIADARKLKESLKQQNIGFNYFEYPGMFHDWILISILKETKDAIKKIVDRLYFMN
ncbi:MAG: alpha/beta hydrolase fold domain-containing protein [Bacteroidales bacterium]